MSARCASSPTIGYVITAIPRGRFGGRETIDKTVLPSLDFDFSFSEFWSDSAGIPGGHTVMVEDLAPSTTSLPLPSKPNGRRNQIGAALERLDVRVTRDGLPGTKEVLIGWLGEALDAANREHYGEFWHVGETTLRDYLSNKRNHLFDKITENQRVATARRKAEPAS